MLHSALPDTPLPAVRQAHHAGLKHAVRGLFKPDCDDAGSREAGRSDGAKSGSGSCDRLQEELGHGALPERGGEAAGGARPSRGWIKAGAAATAAATAAGGNENAASTSNLATEEGLDTGAANAGMGFSPGTALDADLAAQLQAYCRERQCAVSRRCGGAAGVADDFDVWTEALAHQVLYKGLAAAAKEHALASPGVPVDDFLLGVLYRCDAAFLLDLVPLHELSAVLRDIAAEEGDAVDPEHHAVSCQCQGQGQGQGGARALQPRLAPGAACSCTLPEAQLGQFRCWRKELFLREFEHRVNDSLLTSERVGIDLVQSIYGTVQQSLAPLSAPRRAALDRLVARLFRDFAATPDATEMSLEALSAMVNSIAVRTMHFL